jgi:Na+/H+-translocating membrane pyrophosphatase
MSQANSFLNYSDADLKASMHRAIRATAILAVVGFLALIFTLGWQTAVLFLTGAVVSATGLYEWQQLIGVINAKLDNQRSPRATGFTLTMFFLRLGFAALLIYVSLRWLNGSLYALVAGLSLAIIALTVEALRLLRS